jgi:DAK2 domain fusion protein YloV
MRDSLRVQGLKNVIQRFHDRLHQYRDVLNRLNVYPVPDGDTGTNMALTAASVVEESSAAETMEEFATALTRGSLMGARGNSGVILSQILGGLADAFRGAESVGTEQLVEALDSASSAAYEAVLRPVEGTILTVLREAAEAASERRTPEGEDLAGFLQGIYTRAEASLQRTPELLPVLKEAGVVDAGGAGFLLLLAAFLEEVTGSEIDLAADIYQATGPTGVVPHDEAGVGGLRYEVMFFLDAADDALPAFRKMWGRIGDSIVIVGREGTYNCHIHTDDIGAAIEAGVEAGRPYRIQVTDLVEQADAHHASLAFTPLPAFADAPVGVVAVAAGAGIVDLYRDLGAQGVVVGGQTMNPSTEDILSVVEAVAADRVVVLPNNKNIIPVANQLNALTEKQVLTVPTRTTPHGLAAMIAYRPTAADLGLLAREMMDAAEAVAAGQTTRAVRDAQTPVGPVKEGDWLGLIDDEVAMVCGSLDDCVSQLFAALVGPGSEIVTVLAGEGAVESVTAYLEELASGSGLEIEVVAGGQPLYPYMISVE